MIEIYHYAVKNLVGEDTYLKNRLKYITAEQGNDYVENVIKRKTPISDKEVNIRAELLHMLAKEAWRNPEAYKELMAKSFTEEQRFYPSKAEFFTSSGSDSSHKKVDKRSEVYHGVEPQVEIKV